MRPAPKKVPPPGLFRDVLLDPERDSVPEARPVVSLRGDEDPDFEREVRQREHRRLVLERRGVSHGTLAVLEPAGLIPPRPRRRRREVIAAQRFCAAQPLFFPRLVVPAGALAREAAALHARLERGELCAWLAEAGVALADPDAPRFDPERDFGRAIVAPELGAELWLKAGRLSTHPGDRSLRLRVSFGREELDDASPDEPRHRAVSALGQALFPGAHALLGAPELAEWLQLSSGTKLYATQGIAYWNAPGGGALFHHDAFFEEGSGGQRGVLYWQASGATLWLALSMEDLVARVREFAGWLAAGELPWLCEELALGAADLEWLRDVTSRRAVLVHELALPGCGGLGRILDRSQEFTALCADAGHALCLEPGDALLLPNHGPERTAMHSVFHAGGEIAYGLSFALREDRS
jgi:hypothetical protein